MNYKIEKDIPTIFERIWLILVLLLITYYFFFQYAVKAIGGVMIVLCGAVILCGCIKIFLSQSGKLERSMMGPIVVFVFSSVVLTITVTSHGRYRTDICIIMIEYVLTAYSIYLLLKTRFEFFRFVLWLTCISVTLLAATTFTHGTVVTSTGAIGIVGLNTNSMSSFYIFATFACFVLLGIERKMITKIMLVACVIIIMFSMVAAASRRGFIVISAFIGISVLFGIVPLKSENRSKARFLLYFLAILLLVVALLYIQNYLLENTVLGSRLMGYMDTGDSARDKYQNFARIQFQEHPIFGIGLGGIAYYMGAYSHSLYYEIFSCTGIILSCFLLIALLKYGTKFFQNQKRYKNMDKFKYYIAIEGFLYWLSIVVSGVSMTMIYDLYFYLSLAILAGMLVIVESYDDEIY